MFKSIDEALNVVQSREPNLEEFLSACEYLIDHAANLRFRVFINLPGGLRGNIDPSWEKVKKHTVSRCDCGNERVLNPLNPRTEFQAAEVDPITLSAGEKLYFRPIGGDLPSTYIRIEVTEDSTGLSLMDDPFAPFIFSEKLFSTPGFKLDSLQEALESQDEPGVLMKPMGGYGIPVFGIISANASAGTVLVIPDVAIEVLTEEEVDAEEKTGKDHEC